MHLSYKAGQVVSIDESVHNMIGLCSYGKAREQLRRPVQAVRQVASGVLVPYFLASCIRYSAASPRLLSRPTDLSRREQEVLDALLKNLPNKESASKLLIPERTVKFHVANLLAKSGANAAPP